MFDIELKSGKRKRKSPGLQQPLPVPIASLTGIKANDAIWRFYHGKWNQELNMVVIENPQEIEFVKNMGSFGTIFRHWRAKRTKKDESEKKVVKSLVKLCDVDPSVSNEKFERTEIENNVEDPKSEEEEEINENSEISSSNNDKKTELYLSPFEAFYLSFGLGCLVVREEENDELHLTIDALWRKFNQSNPNFCEEYAVYHHFRSKGWVVKDGTKFGVEFLLYQEGPAFFHAQYSVKIVSENSPMTWKTLSGLNRVTESTSKELLLAEISQNNSDISSEEFTELKNVEEMRKKSSKIVQKLLSVRVTENIVKRWVPTQERENQN